MSLGGVAILLALALVVPLVGGALGLFLGFLWFPFAMLRIADGSEWVTARGRLRRRRARVALPVAATVSTALAVWFFLTMVVVAASEPLPRPDLTMPLVAGECVLDRAVVDGVAPTAFQVMETRLCGPDAKRCWRRYALTGGQVVELGTVCEGTQLRELSPRWAP